MDAMSQTVIDDITDKLKINGYKKQPYYGYLSHDYIYNHTEVRSLNLVGMQFNDITNINEWNTYHLTPNQTLLQPLSKPIFCHMNRMKTRVHDSSNTVKYYNEYILQLCNDDQLNNVYSKTIQLYMKNFKKNTLSSLKEPRDIGIIIGPQPRYHYRALYISHEKKIILVFDSNTKPSYNQQFYENFVKKQLKNCGFNTDLFMSYVTKTINFNQSSDACGMYCSVFFLYCYMYRNKLLDLVDPLRELMDKKYLNEINCNNIVKTLLFNEKYLIGVEYGSPELKIIMDNAYGYNSDFDSTGILIIYNDDLTIIDDSSDTSDSKNVEFGRLNTIRIDQQSLPSFAVSFAIYNRSTIAQRMVELKQIINDYPDINKIIWIYKQSTSNPYMYFSKISNRITVDVSESIQCTNIFVNEILPLGFLQAYWNKDVNSSIYSYSRISKNITTDEIKKLTNNILKIYTPVLTVISINPINLNTHILLAKRVLNPSQLDEYNKNIKDKIDVTESINQINSVPIISSIITPPIIPPLQSGISSSSWSLHSLGKSLFNIIRPTTPQTVPLIPNTLSAIDQKDLNVHDKLEKLKEELKIKYTTNNTEKLKLASLSQQSSEEYAQLMLDIKTNDEKLQNIIFYLYIENKLTNEESKQFLLYSDYSEPLSDYNNEHYTNNKEYNLIITKLLENEIKSDVDFVNIYDKVSIDKTFLTNVIPHLKFIIIILYIYNIYLCYIISNIKHSIENLLNVYTYNTIDKIFEDYKNGTLNSYNSANDITKFYVDKYIEEYKKNNTNMKKNITSMRDIDKSGSSMFIINNILRTDIQKYCLELTTLHQVKTDVRLKIEKINVKFDNYKKKLDKIIYRKHQNAYGIKDLEQKDLSDEVKLNEEMKKLNDKKILLQNPNYIKILEFKNNIIKLDQEFNNEYKRTIQIKNSIKRKNMIIKLKSISAEKNKLFEDLKLHMSTTKQFYADNEESTIPDVKNVALAFKYKFEHYDELKKFEDTHPVPVPIQKNVYDIITYIPIYNDIVFINNNFDEKTHSKYDEVKNLVDNCQEFIKFLEKIGNIIYARDQKNIIEEINNIDVSKLTYDDNLLLSAVIHKFEIFSSKKKYTEKELNKLYKKHIENVKKKEKKDLDIKLKKDLELKDKKHYTHLIETVDAEKKNELKEQEDMKRQFEEEHTKYMEQKVFLGPEEETRLENIRDKQINNYKKDLQIPEPVVNLLHPTTIPTKTFNPNNSLNNKQFKKITIDF
jgi:hypothetical protein